MPSARIPNASRAAMTSAPPEARARVAVFAKAPVPGEVKTRLAPLLGPEGAAALHAGLVRQALSTAAMSGVGDVELWCAPDASHPFFVRCAEQFTLTLHRQAGADLGERMRSAFDAGLASGGPVVLIGSDCPVLAPADLREALQALETHDAAIAPAEDGGYVLVALARPMPALFEGIEWGSAAVMGATRARLAAAKARWQELPMRWDVDRPEDYARLQREGILAEVMS
jgi:rSAM/selenodomain-associated transferase 1